MKLSDVTDAKVLWAGDYLGGRLVIASDLFNSNLLYYTYESPSAHIIGSYTCYPGVPTDEYVEDLKNTLTIKISETIMAARDNQINDGTTRLH